MSTGQNNNAAQAKKKGEESILKSVTLLALPWLNFQGKILDLMKAGIQDASNIKPFKMLAQHELHALMMIFDSEGKWRNSIGADLEKKLEDAYNDTIAKISAGSISFIEAQQALIASLIDAANKERTKATTKGDGR
jgi:hypothetical protein